MSKTNNSILLAALVLAAPMAASAQEANIEYSPVTTETLSLQNRAQYNSLVAEARVGVERAEQASQARPEFSYEEARQAITSHIPDEQPAVLSEEELATYTENAMQAENAEKLAEIVAEVEAMVEERLAQVDAPKAKAGGMSNSNYGGSNYGGDAGDFGGDAGGFGGDAGGFGEGSGGGFGGDSGSGGGSGGGSGSDGGGSGGGSGSW